MAPVILYVGLFFALVGVEEVTNTAIIGEGYARSLFLAAAVGVVLVLSTTLVFSVVILAMKRKKSMLDDKTS